MCKRKDTKKCITGIYNYDILSNKDMAEAFYFQEVGKKIEPSLALLSDFVAKMIYTGYDTRNDIE